MIVKIIKLVTGEEIVSLAEDLIDENNNKIGFNLTFPYQVILRPLPMENGETKFDINYVAWMSTSANTVFAMNYSSVVSMGDPLPEVEKLYMERYEEMMWTMTGD